MRRERVLIVCLGEVGNDARVLRQVEFLSADYEVVLAAFGPKPSLPPGAAYVPLPPRKPVRIRGRAESLARIGARLTGRYEAAYWLDQAVRGWRTELERELPVDAILVNDLHGLPLARALGDDVPVVFDAHEHWTSESASWTRRQRISMRGAHEWIVDRFVPADRGHDDGLGGDSWDYREAHRRLPVTRHQCPVLRATHPHEGE